MAQGKLWSTVKTVPAAGAVRKPHASPGWALGGSGKGESKPQPARLGRQAVLLLAVQGTYAAANALSGTFVPIYLWKASQSYALIGWFSLAQHLVSGMTFWIAGAWIKSHDKMAGLRAGLVGSGLFYLIVLLLGTSASRYAVPLGALNGLAVGLFWLAYNVVYFEITGPENRDRFNGWAGLLGALSGMTAPWLSGTVIGLTGGTRGYRIIFAASLAMLAAAAAGSFFLKKRRAEGRFAWSHGWRLLRTPGNPWRNIVPALAAQGLREGVYVFLLGLLVFLATGKERSLGNYALWTSLASLAAFWLAGRFLRPQHRRWTMLAGAAAVSGMTAILFKDVHYATLLTAGIGTALFMPLYVIPMTSAVFDLIGSTREGVKRREELIALRETGLIAGRIIGLVIYLIVVAYTQSTAALTWMLLAVGASPLAGWLFIRRRLPS